MRWRCTIYLIASADSQQREHARMYGSMPWHTCYLKALYHNYITCLRASLQCHTCICHSTVCAQIIRGLNFRGFRALESPRIFGRRCSVTVKMDVGRLCKCPIVPFVGSVGPNTTTLRCLSIDHSVLLLCSVQ